VQAVLGMTLSAKNANHFPQAFAAARREIPGLGYEDFHLNIVHESTHYFGNTDLGLKQRIDAGALARATEEYTRLRGQAYHPVAFLERAYLKGVRRYLETGGTPMRCHALRASCFIDSWGNVFPCTIYDRKLGNLREVGFDLGRIWNTPAAAALQADIWESRCPNCWTPCEAYQSILGNLIRPTQ
jgi:MoaA/NifB/PqqE/SkfB family radical SAM enzyme